ncbi:OmpA family protein [Palleronia aestuarii]|uniref:OmpA family protein n=1 Tax=Palleronia aestuarii TaxID=568105 RepID=A0A2W7NQL5_9RHOB|nr:OmpA family protein [Palleronia aestuarii]PZX18924.1 OmpA family protein [Palleronia aestuarii]
MLGYSIRAITAIGFLSLSSAAFAQDDSASSEAPDSLKVYFELGQSSIAADQAATLDQAARLFRDGNPYVMILSGGADTVGPADLNLDLSLARARAVADGLEARGIPVNRLQVLGRGNTELAVDTEDDVAEERNRLVEITWR